jgi:hypothetical protein
VTVINSGPLTGNLERFQQPLSKTAMEVITMLVEKGNHTKLKKSKKVAPGEGTSA